MSIATGKRLRSSLCPSCLPAYEKGGHGSPPETMSTPLKAEASVRVVRSCSSTFQAGRLRRKVAQACGSISIRPLCSMPACSSPRDWPPAPAHNSNVDRTGCVVAVVKLLSALRIVTRNTSFQAVSQINKRGYGAGHSPSIKYGCGKLGLNLRRSQPHVTGRVSSLLNCQGCLDDASSPYYTDT